MSYTDRSGIKSRTPGSWVTIHRPFNHRATAAPGSIIGVNTRADNTTIQFTFLYIQKFFSELKQTERFVQAL